MNIFGKIWCRLYQGVFRLVMPFMPYREPKVMESVLDIKGVLKEKGITLIIAVITTNNIIVTVTVIFLFKISTFLTHQTTPKHITLINHIFTLIPHLKLIINMDIL